MIGNAWPRPTVAEDERALETDIMRFMAILGFCLMAVFALIQAIPLSNQEPGVGLQTQQQVMAEVAALLEELDEIKDIQSDLQVSVAQIRDQQAQLVEINQENELLKARNQQLEQASEQLRSRLQDIHADLTKQSVAANKLAEKLQDERESLVDARHELNKLHRRVDTERRKLSSVEQKLDDVRKQAQALQEPKSTTPVSVERKKVAPPPTETSAETKPAVLTMRFHSTGAIDRLIAGGRTVLYGAVGDRVWRSSPTGGFTTTARPKRTYELTEDPGGLILNRFRRSAGLISAQDIRWWVTFDARILEQIGQQLDSQTSGELVIHADGSVRHNVQ